MNKKYLSTGNEACAEGAIRAGCYFYAGYPITPQNELTAYMSRRMEEENRVFIQAESELAAINMIYGASAVGVRAMTSSSSPGISLKQEGISYMAGAQLPGVIVNVMRGGPGLGNIAPSQSDYFQATKGGGHGDYKLLVLAPANVQEMFDFTYNAFALSDKYRNPVMILSDGMIGQMMESLEFDDNIKPVGIVEKPWALTGASNRKSSSIKTLLLKADALEKRNEILQTKYKEMIKKEQQYETYKVEDAQIIFVAYGTMSRIAKSCVDQLRNLGIKIGLLRPITLFPFPSEKISQLSNKTDKFFVLEMSAGQMVEDVQISVKNNNEVLFYGRMGGGIPTENDIIDKVKELYKK